MRRRAADECFDEKGAAALTCGLAALAAAKSVVAAATGVGWPVAALEVGIATLAAANCARLFVAKDACVERFEANHEAAATCEASGGVPFVGARADELICRIEP